MKYVILTISIFCFLSACNRKTTPKIYYSNQHLVDSVTKDSIIEHTKNNIYTPQQEVIKPNNRRFYWTAFNEIKQMLAQNNLDFKKSVFITENAWFEDSLDYQLFDAEIQRLAYISKQLSKKKIIEYDFPDYEQVNLNAAIFKIITDTTTLLSSSNISFKSMPYSYDFSDFSGKKDWTKMFVSKLLITNQGNCHSIPFLYKILAEELHSNAWLAFAPHHIYIKSKCKKRGMYNTELTSGEFPTDAWIACSGYISTESIQSGIYMDTLSLKQSVAYTLYDLAKGYQRKFGVEDGEFILTCINELTLYYPNSINALLLKAETLRKLVQPKLNEVASNNDIANKYTVMENTYSLINKLGYNEMPEQNYKEWLEILHTKRQQNIEINTIFKPKSK
jgi:hypothetical protein